MVGVSFYNKKNDQHKYRENNCKNDNGNFNKSVIEIAFEIRFA